MFKAHLFSAILILSLIILNYSETQAQVPTTLNDFFLPGSQPNESGNFNAMPSNCGCHGGYNEEDVEPMYNWQGSMMAQAMRDPLYLATLKIANQDADSSGDLCIRCHAPRGWLSGRSTPTDGSDLTDKDREGIYCGFCHRAVKPTSIGVNPYSSDDAYTDSTYSFDQTYLQTIDGTIDGHIPSTSANGMYIIDSDDTRRGPYTEANSQALHGERYSPFHSDAYFCGTCHDVSNPVFTKVGDSYVPVVDNLPAPSFDPYTMFPVERTFSEWKMSAYNTPEGVSAPQFGGNKTIIRTCQDCHMQDVTGHGCNKDAPLRDDLPLHDMTGGNTFIPTLLYGLYDKEVNEAALNSGISRATYMLQNAATLGYSTVIQPDDWILLTITVTNETGHKLPSGYPEGRRIWLNVIAYDASDNNVFESGAYNNNTGELTHDDDVKIYEIEPGFNGSPSFHFVLNNEIIKDNRIPPRGFTNANFEAIQSPPVNYTYADGQYWDDTQYLLPPATNYFTVNLYYQTTSKEYVEFLRDEEENPPGLGQDMYDLWVANGRSAPVLMATIDNTPVPVELISFTAKVINKYVELNWRTATEINNYGFDIERSVDIGKWLKIGFVEGHGNSNSPKQYSYSDKNPTGGSNFKYRLKQIDNDGKFEYSAVVNVKLVPDEFTLYQNYPNPFNPDTKIKYYVPQSSRVQITVYDILSNKIAMLVNEEKPAGSYEVQFDASNLPSGVYFYKLQAGSFTKTMKMMLVK